MSDRAAQQSRYMVGQTVKVVRVHGMRYEPPRQGVIRGVRWTEAFGWLYVVVDGEGRKYLAVPEEGILP